MKIKCLCLTAFILAISSIGFAQSKIRTVAPDIIVRNLYAAQKTGLNPFFQTKNRAVVDKYFAEDLADLIWKDAVKAKGEVGAIDFNPLYYAQDTKITHFKVGKPGYGDINLVRADVLATFKNMGKDKTIIFRFIKNADKIWKITNIFYSSTDSRESLRGILFDAAGVPYFVPGRAVSITSNYTGKGELKIGAIDSVILQFNGKPSDYAAYCFTNKSAVGRAILAKCKNGQQCQFTGTVESGGDNECKVPESLNPPSSRRRIIEFSSVKLVATNPTAAKKRNN
jgi:hypothetical protein